MAAILVSFCNTPWEPSQLSLGVLDTEKHEVRFLDYADVIRDFSFSGVTGLCRGPDGYFAALQGWESVILLQLDRSLRPIRVIETSKTHDVHSIRWHADAILAVATRSNRVFSIHPVTGEGKEVWIGAEEETDVLHVNGLEMVDGHPIVSAFGRCWRKDAGGGQLIDIASGDVMLSSIREPHSPVLVGEDLYIAESMSGTVQRRRRGEWSVIAEVGPYCRGLVAVGDALWIGVSAMRGSSRTTGQRHSLLWSKARALQHFRCTLRRFDLRAQSLDSVEIDLTTYGLEVYDLLALEDADLSAAPLVEFSASRRSYLIDDAWRDLARQVHQLRQENQSLKATLVD
jgi:Domain of unknown function (DUF4915)